MDEIWWDDASMVKQPSSGWETLSTVARQHTKDIPIIGQDMVDQ